MSEFLCIPHGKDSYILNKNSILSISINTYFRKIDIFMTNKVVHNITYGAGLEENFEQAVAIIQNRLFK